ncbi:hypothetical protein [Solirubrum puertoriconensis]|uniref:Uncharacterized protein n=1 Tax=Solirubrum puertoriconensis TaxID=1751427 RepID=A0A9X0L451_SOLP1|nr:hypothetical protein [Solirubrum puertoriconensis]KUG07239.1 hypothetical protein ASU33_12765 [Solirubrum puertoriconensis]
MTLRIKNIAGTALVTTLLLLIPFVAMKFDTGVNWSGSDFAIAGALIFITGLVGQLLVSQSGTLMHRLAGALAVAAGFLSLWVNLAVGIIGSGPNGANLMFAAVFVTVFIGSARARLQPRGMAQTMFAAALVQFLVPVVALLIWQSEPMDMEGMAGNMIFVGMWAVSGWLYRQARSLRSA